MPSQTNSHKRGGQKPEEYIDNTLCIVPQASAPDQDKKHNLFTIPHKALCERLLPLTNAWDNLFLLSIISLPALTLPQEEKLEKIASRHLKAWDESQGRLCRHCGKKAQNIDQFSYFCPQCGNCINYFWYEGGVK